MNGERFTAADLEPSDEEKLAQLRTNVDRIAATLAVLAAGVWVGGMVALGACAAPFVFRLTPAPYSGDAMGAAFARFDQIALGAAVVLLGAEVARTWAARGRARQLAARIRRVAAVSIAGLATYGGLLLTPQIIDLHRQGVQRGVGPQGALLESIHHRAESVGKVETVLGVVLVALHVFTLPVRRPEDDDDDDAYATPLPPGPREG
ncbi:Hypothetical protein A7982_08663 [Minicystis rosea]|nr:Hypothetical protein A7982_08663 [Minicystis rosea]